MTKAEERRAYLQAQSATQPQINIQPTQTITKADQRRLELQQAQQPVVQQPVQTQPVPAATQPTQPVVEQPKTTTMADKLKTGARLTPEETIQAAVEMGKITPEEAEFQKKKLNASKQVVANTYANPENYEKAKAQPVQVVEIAQGKEDAKQVQVTKENAADTYIKAKENLQEAKATNNTREIAKNEAIVEEAKNKYKANNNEQPNIDIPSLRNKLTGLAQDLGKIKADYDNAITPEQQNRLADEYNATLEQFNEKQKVYNNAVAYDEIVNNNMVSDIGKSSGIGFLAGVGKIENGVYAAGNKLSGMDATTINADSLLRYNNNDTNWTDYLKDAASMTTKISPYGMAATATGALESPNTAYQHLALLASANPDNIGLKRLFNQITNHTYQGTAEDLRNELDKIQKELYQGFKDVSGTYNTLTKEREQLAHNENVYENAAFIPNAFNTVTNMLPSQMLAPIGGEALTLTALGLGAGSQGMDEALESGARYNQAFNYGVATGATEAATEKMFESGLNKAIGIKGTLDPSDLSKKLIDSLGIKNSIGKAVINTLGDTAGEMTEEMVAEAVNPLWRYITYDQDAFKNFNPKQILQAGVDAIPSTLLMEATGLGIQNVKVNQIERGIIKSINESELSPIVKTRLTNEVKEAAKDMRIGLEDNINYNVAENAETLIPYAGNAITNETQTIVPEAVASTQQVVAPQVTTEVPKVENVQNNVENKITTDKALSNLRDFKEVGNRQVNAYQYENPEVKPFFQHEAENMLMDLDNAIKGERTATWDDYGELHYSGTTREVTKDIAQLLDGDNGVKLSYDDIRKGLNAIIKDQGSENIAAAKRIEMVLDERLRKGYTDSFGTYYEPNENYKNFLEGKEYIDPAEYESQRADRMIEEQYGDNTQYSLSEKETAEVNDYIDKMYEDKTLDETFKDQVINRLNNVQNYSDFEAIRDEVSNYKDKMYKGISGLVDIANSTEEDVKQREMEYKQRKDKNTTHQRKFFDNVETSPIVADETKSRINPTTYEVKHNLDTLETMRQRLDERGNDLIEDWKHKSKNFNDNDVALGAILLERYQQQGDWNSAARTAEKLADMSTETARALQMYSIWQRLSPETMQIFTQKQLNEAFEEMKQRKTGKWVEANKDKFKLTAEESQFIYDQVEKASQAIDDETKQRELSKIENMINNKLPPEKGQTIKALRRIAMLFNPKTQVRNIAGNTLIMPVNDVADLVGTAIDKAVARKTGVRTTSTPNLITKAKGFGKGIKAAVTDYKTGTRTTASGSKYEFDLGAKPFNENTNSKVRNNINRMLNGVNDLLSAVMSGGDRPFYEAAYQNSLEGQMKANKVTEPTQEMKDIAVNEALQRTWNDDNNYTKTVLSIRKAMNNINIKGFGLGDLIIPFAKTPANLTKAMVEYSPAGFIESVIDFNDMRKAISRGEMTPAQQKKFVTSTSKAIAGSMLYLIAGTLAKSGKITGSADDDKDVKNFEQNVLGIQPYSVRIGDKTYTYSWANPINAPLAIMADTYKMSKEDASKWDILNNAFKVAGETLVDNSFLQGIKELFSKDSISEGIVDAIESFPESMIPTFLSQIASLNDSKQRQTFEYQNDLQTIANKIKNKIPGLRNTLEPQVNTFGEEIENQNNAFNAFLNPANVREARITDSQKALYDVYQETKDKTIFPMQAPYYTNTDNGEKQNLTTQDRATYQKASGQYVNDAYESLFDDEVFKDLKNEGKVKILHEIATDGNLKGRESVGAVKEETNSNLDKLNERNKELEKANIPLADYYIAWYAKNNLAQGKTHDSQKKAIRDYTDLTADQEEVLYGIFNIQGKKGS